MVQVGLKELDSVFKKTALTETAQWFVTCDEPSILDRRIIINDKRTYWRVLIELLLFNTERIL